MVCVAAAQVLHFPTPGDAMTTSMSIDAIQAAQMDFNGKYPLKSSIYLVSRDRTI
jgi:hypothetical protein